MRMRLLNNMLNLLGVGNIKSHGENGVSKALLQISHVCQSASRSGDLIAAHECRLCPDASKTTRGTSDKPNLASHETLLL